VQAQSHSADAVLTATIDTAPTGQSQPAPQTSSISTMPVVASFSGLSRATLETTVQIAAQITRQLAGRSTRFEMGLTPEGLGKVNVSMDIDADGQLTARLAFDNPLAAADLRARVDELRGQLQDAGFKLADDALTFSHQDASSRDGGAAEQRRDQNQGRAFAAASRMADDADTTSPVPAWVSLSLTPRGVDMKV
jgi:flagellar hook-length control protein FliK